MQQVFAPPHRIFRHQLNLFEYASSFPLQLKFNALSKRILWTPSLLCLPPFCYHPKHFLSWWVSFEASQFPLTSAFFWVGGIVCVHVSKRLHQIPEVWRECAICCHISLIIWYFSCMLYFVWTSLPRTYNRIKLGGLRVGQLWRGGGFFYAGFGDGATTCRFIFHMMFFLHCWPYVFFLFFYSLTLVISLFFTH